MKLRLLLWLLKDPKVCGFLVKMGWKAPKGVQVDLAGGPGEGP